MTTEQIIKLLKEENQKLFAESQKSYSLAKSWQGKANDWKSKFLSADEELNKVEQTVDLNDSKESNANEVRTLLIYDLVKARTSAEASYELGERMMNMLIDRDTITERQVLDVVCDWKNLVKWE